MLRNFHFSQDQLVLEYVPPAPVRCTGDLPHGRLECGMRMWLKNWDLLGQLGPDASHYHSSSKSTNWLERFMDVQGLSCRPITSYNFIMNSRKDLLFFRPLDLPVRQATANTSPPGFRWIIETAQSNGSRHSAETWEVEPSKGVKSERMITKKHYISGINSYHTYTLRILYNNDNNSNDNNNTFTGSVRPVLNCCGSDWFGTTAQ